MNNSELKNEYEAIASTCEQFGKELTRQLEELLLQKRITLGFPIQFRVKPLDSLSQKIEQRLHTMKSVSELNDLIGLRIVLLFKRDIELVRRLIKRHFKIHSEENTQTRLSDGEFGYLSIHLQIGLRPEWKKIPTLQRAGHFQAEIQLRTVAQHIWAAASHVLQYKNESSTPQPVRRSISRASALLETVDLEFERVLEQRAQYRRRLKADSPEDINVDLLEKILDAEWPAENKEKEEDYSRLLYELSDFSITTSLALKKLLKRHHAVVMKEDKSTAMIQLKAALPQDPDRLRCENGLWFTHCGLTRLALLNEFGEDYEIYKNRKNEEALIRSLES